MTKKIISNLLHKELSYFIHGAAIEVRRDFGPGHKEKLYHTAFAAALNRRKTPFEKEKSIKIYSPKDGKYVGLYRPDFIIDKKIIIEIKAERFVGREEIKRIYDYLRNSNYELAYFINFAYPELFIKRIIYTNPHKPFLVKILASISLILALFSGLNAEAAQLFFDTSSANVGLNQEFEVILRLDPQDQVVNAIQAKISYPENLQLIAVDDSNSVVGLWIRKPTEQSGAVSFAGIIPGGYSGDLSPYWQGPRPGKILSLIFSADKSGLTDLNLNEAKVLLNDGKGTEASLILNDLELMVKEGIMLPRIQSLAKRGTTPPEAFTPIVARDPNIFDNQWFLVFTTKDYESGIDHYEVLEKYQSKDVRGLLGKLTGQEGWLAGESPYLLKDQNLTSYIYVKAVNRAKNERIAVVEPRNLVPWYDNYLTWCIIVLAIALFYEAEKLRKKKLLSRK